MNKKILILWGLIWSISGFSQKILNAYSAPQTVVDGSSIRMLPGFHANSNDGSYNNVVVFIAKIGNPSTETVPPSPNISNTNTSSGENYIYSRSYLVPVTESNAYAPQVQSITYLDGLGRAKQNISIKSTPGGNDVVKKIEYDGFGRQIFDFLQMPQAGTTNSAIYGSVSESVGAPLYGLGPYFAKKDIENSPLERLNSTTAPGDWNTNSKKVVLEYLANGNNEVLRFNTSTGWSSDAKSVTETNLSLAAGNYYSANTLYKNKVTDEDGNVTYEFKNSQGQILLVRKMLNATDAADTYYVYNEYDQLAYVLSPLASEAIKNNPAIDLSFGGTTLSQLCYQYQYDSRNRLAEKKLPGKGKEYMVYDRQDRLVMSRDTNLSNQGKWIFTKYDKFGRVAFTGMATGGSRSTEQTGADAAGSNNVTRESNVQATINGIGLMYSQTGNYPDVSELLNINYYDTYPAYADAPSVSDADQYGQKFLTQAYTYSDLNPNTQISTKGLPTASLVKTIDADTWTKTFTFYDQKARPIYTQSNNHLGGYTLTGSSLDFSGTVLQSYTRHKRSTATTPAEVKINEHFVYDYQNRLMQHYHQVDSGAEVLLTDNTYDELGRLISKTVGNNLQTMAFDYNIRGWMTGINRNDISSAAPFTLDNGKLFAYEIRYNNPKNESVAAKRYNGNIAEVEWINKDGSLKRYGYQYDKLNRLSAGIYQDPENDVPESHANDEVLSYDLNGNIRTLVRNAPGFKSHISVIDDLTYGYEGNRVVNINDQSDNASGYEGGAAWIPYDDNGNMTAMPDKGINDIAYNFLNLPQQIDQDGNLLKYDYRADGVKLKKRFTFTNALGIHSINTEYLDGFQYSTPNTEPLRRSLQETDAFTANATTAGELEAFSAPDQLAVVDPGPVNEALLLSFFPTAEGYYDYENKLYIYQYKDHLGNVRVSFTKTSTGEIKVMDTNDYYPFGMNFLKSNQVTVYDPMAIPYNYKYNGKELQETGMYDYGARFYMPDIGRWGVVDPLAEKMTRHSTYNYAFDNPIMFIDADGRESEHINPKGFNKTADNTNKLAMREFVNTKEGYAFFAQYAKAGDEIGGVKFTKDGEYHKQGIDINVGTDVTTNGASGEATSTMTSGRLEFNMNIGNGKSFIANGIENIAHEGFIHILPQTNDFLDNGKFDYSKGYDKGAVSYLKSKYEIDGKHNGGGWIDHYLESASNSAGNKYISPILNQYFNEINKIVSQKDINNSIRGHSINAVLTDKDINYIKSRNGQ